MVARRASTVGNSGLQFDFFRIKGTFYFTVNSNNSFENYTQAEDHTRQTAATSGFRPFHYAMEKMGKMSSVVGMYLIT